MAAAYVLDASAVLRKITHYLMGAAWAQQLQEAPLVVAPELMHNEVAKGLDAGHISASQKPKNGVDPASRAFRLNLESAARQEIDDHSLARPVPCWSR